MGKKSMNLFGVGTTLLVAAGCAGSGTSQAGPAVAPYAAPVTVQWTGPTDQLGFDDCINQSGQMVGAIPSGKYGIAASYWPLPSAAPSVMAAPANAFSYYRGECINNMGEIAGESDINAQSQHQPLYWASPTAAPTVLKIPAGATDVSALSINDSHEIVGTSTANNSIVSLFWSSPSATPVVLSGGTGVAAIQINNAHMILGEPATSINGAVWKNPASAPVILSVPSNSGADIKFMDVKGNVCGDITGSIDKAAIWSPPSYNLQYLKTPAGYKGSGAFAMNSSGVIVGYVNPTSTSSSKGQAVIWKSLTAEPTLLDSQVASKPDGVFHFGRSILDNGNIIVRGKPSSTATTTSLYWLVKN